jgi:glycerol-3-phosphate dehydrogenase
MHGDDHTPILLSVFGGKITTYRKLAEHALEKLQPLLGGSIESWTGSTALPGGDITLSRKPDDDFERFVAHTQTRWPFLSASLARRLARTYGTRLASILGDAKSLDDLGEDFGAGLTQSEVDYLCKYEWAQTTDDILWRRTKMGLHVPNGAADKLSRYLATITSHSANESAS